MEKSRHFFGLLKPQPGGQGTIKANLEAAVRQGHKIAALIPPEMNAEAERLWGYFLELHNARGSSGFGPLPISYTEIEAWTRLCNVPLEPWEVRAIRLTDAQAVATMMEKPGGG